MKLHASVVKKPCCCICHVQGKNIMVKIKALGRWFPKSGVGGNISLKKASKLGFCLAGRDSSGNN